MPCRPDPSDEKPPYSPIGDYAIVGNCRTAALISRSGSIDWFCLPRIDGASVFGALLDARKGGSFRVGPVGNADVSRHYVGDSNVLETTFRTATGTITITDLMPIGGETGDETGLVPDHELLRIVRGIDGTVEVEVVCRPRPDYGRDEVGIRKCGAIGWRLDARRQAMLLRSDIDLAPVAVGSETPSLHGTQHVGAGERVVLSLSHCRSSPAVVPLLGDDADGRLRRTLAWWQGWSAECRHGSEFRDVVLRSALTLKTLCFSPSGAVVAAPTTSLPEHIGGRRNWDYRYCWLRDASLTVRAMMNLGYDAEAGAFLNWLLYTTKITQPWLGVMYDVYGDPRLGERELDELEGYRRSQPVRVGNSAHSQLQLDVYGSVMDAAWHYAEAGGTLDRGAQRMLRGFARVASEQWNRPDEGIWEPRAQRQHHTFSKAMCWVAVDRLLRLADEGHVEGVDVDAYRASADEIRSDVRENGYDEALGSYVSVYGGDQVDASLLLLSIYGFEDHDSERMVGTCLRVLDALGDGASLYRYRGVDDGLPAGEGTFGIAGFWAVEALALAGRVDEARDRYETLLSTANDVGLMAEERDPDTGLMLGNFPQAFTHVGVINGAVTLAEMTGIETGRTSAG